jgi:hypothetical protein
MEFSVPVTFTGWSALQPEPALTGFFMENAKLGTLIPRVPDRTQNTNLIIPALIFMFRPP